MSESVIFELTKNNFVKVLPLYLREGIVFPLILAVIQQRQPGWVFVDDELQPASALVITKFGFMQLIGTDKFCDDALNLFAVPKDYLPSYLLWYSPSPQIQKTLDGFMPIHVKRRERARFVFQKQITENFMDCPTGFEKQYLDKELMTKTEHFNLEIGSRFWVSTKDFLEYGLGACVIKNGEIVSLCYSACVVDNLAEIDVVTKEKYRGLGLAVVAAQLFISECVKRGITPTWDCFVNNTASMKLANHLGFTQTVIYPFYSFNIPANFLSKVNLPVKRGVA